MKKILIGIAGLVLFACIYSCSSTPDPQLRIKNEQLQKVSVKIQTPGSDKFIVNEVESGRITDYQKITTGNITVTVDIQNESVSFLAAKNARYTIVISDGIPPSLHVD
jgi:hypothetical protein